MNTKTKHWASITAGILSLAGYASAASIGSEKYSYDASGNIIEKSIDGHVTKMSYDEANRLTSVSSAAENGEQVTYDEAGRPIAYKDSDGKLTRQLSYGYADKVVEADNAGAEAVFFYNAEGRLIGNSIAGRTTSYAWDGNVLVAEDAETFTNENHISGGVPAMAGDQTALVSDYLGSTLSQGDKQFNSTAYGEGLEKGRFTGKAFVKELGGYTFNHRLYSTVALGWNTPDPMGFPDGVNNLQYVCGDPLTRLDPMGTEEVYCAEDSFRLNGPTIGNNQVSVIVRYIFKYGKGQKPEVTADSVSLQPNQSAGWSNENAEITCEEHFPSPFPDTNKLYWQNTKDDEPGPVEYTNSIVAKISGKYSNTDYSAFKAFSSPEFEK